MHTPGLRRRIKALDAWRMPVTRRLFWPPSAGIAHDLHYYGGTQIVVDEPEVGLAPPLIA